MSMVSVNHVDTQPEDDQAAYPLTTWRLLNTGYADGAANMAVDEAILQAVAAGKVPPTLRFYGWEPACVSIGYSQSLEKEIDLERCRADGVDWVRRPTGGRAILHTDELTYSIVTSLDDPRAHGGVVESYRHLSRGLVAGLAALDIDVVQAELQKKGDRDSLSAACFDIPSHYEVTAHGRKLIGSAQMRRRNVLLQHGTVPLRGDITRLVKYLVLSSEDVRARLRAKLARRATTLEQILGREVPFEEVAAAMAAGFAAALRLDLQPASLSEEERLAVKEIRDERYGNALWNAQR